MPKICLQWSSKTLSGFRLPVPIHRYRTCTIAWYGPQPENPGQSDDELLAVAIMLVRKYRGGYMDLEVLDAVVVTPSVGLLVVPKSPEDSDRAYCYAFNSFPLPYECRFNI